MRSKEKMNSYFYTEPLKIRLKDRYEDFMIWAFGSDYLAINGGICLLNAWNARHASTLRLYPEDSVRDDFLAMIELYEKTLM